MAKHENQTFEVELNFSGSGVYQALVDWAE
jgi:hypothetical protein